MFLHLASYEARWLPRMLKVARVQNRFPAVAELHQFMLRTRCSGGSAHEGEGTTSQLDLLSDAIVRSWLWSTATRSFQLGYFGRLLKVVDN